MINNTIELTVVEVRGKTVKLGFVFPPEATVLRKEIYDKVHAENIAAAGSADDALDFMEGDFDLSHLDSPDKP